MVKRTKHHSIFKLATDSVVHFFQLVSAGLLHSNRERIGQQYHIDRVGTYEIFRETVNNLEMTESVVVLVVGFRLRFIQSIRLFHWFFQRVCIFTTPFWSGFKGFRIKLWMVDPKTKNYLGIYEWAGEENASIYVHALTRVLRALSTSRSVWYELYSDMELSAYLNPHKVSHKLSPKTEPKGVPAHAR